MSTEGRDAALPSLADATWLRKPETQAVLAALQANGQQARIVGGAVRNALLGAPVRDIDIATTAKPSETQRLASKAGLKAIATGVEHGTVTVIAEHTPFEVTTLRRDVETDGRRARVAFTDDWTADARRRDFTMNALYVDADGTLFDPLGGYADLTAQRVRFIGDAGERLREDYLRILRFLRFSAEYGQGALDPTGLAACLAAKGNLARLSRERVRAELLRLLVAPHAVAVVGVVADDFVAPVLPTAPDVHLFGRVAEIEAANAREPDGVRRLGALAGARLGMAERLKDALRLSAKEYERLARLSLPDAAFDAIVPEADGKAFIYRLGRTAFCDGLIVAWARGTAPVDDAQWRERLDLVERWQAPQLPVRGADVTELGVPPGPQVGRVLAAFEDWWISADFPTDTELLAKRLVDLTAASNGETS